MDRKYTDCKIRKLSRKMWWKTKIGAGNNPMVGMTVAVAVSIQEAADAGKF